jgi:hypothetical protein
MSGHLSRLVVRAAQRPAAGDPGALPGSPGAAAWNERHLAAFAARGRPGDRRPRPDHGPAYDDPSFPSPAASSDPRAGQATTAGPSWGDGGARRSASRDVSAPLRPTAADATGDTAADHQGQVSRQAGRGQTADPDADAGRRGRPAAARAAGRGQSCAADRASAADAFTGRPDGRAGPGDRLAGRDLGGTGRGARRSAARASGAAADQRPDGGHGDLADLVRHAVRSVPDGAPDRPQAPNRLPRPGETESWRPPATPLARDVPGPVSVAPAGRDTQRSRSSGPGPADGGPGAVSIRIGRVELVVPPPASPSPTPAAQAAQAGTAADRGNAGHPDLLAAYRGYQARGGPL